MRIVSPIAFSIVTVLVSGFVPGCSSGTSSRAKIHFAEIGPVVAVEPVPVAADPVVPRERPAGVSIEPVVFTLDDERASFYDRVAAVRHGWTRGQVQQQLGTPDVARPDQWTYSFGFVDGVYAEATVLFENGAATGLRHHAGCSAPATP